MKKKDKDYDPSPYDGPIERADGMRPYNKYLWPTESWWAAHQLYTRIPSRFNFGIVALADGRFATCGFVYAIETNEYAGRPCVFATREAALRSSCAGLIRLARASRDWSFDNLQGRRLALVINWAREIVAKETGRELPRPIVIKGEQLIKKKTGFPLFDFLQETSCQEI